MENPTKIIPVGFFSRPIDWTNIKGEKKPRGQVGIDPARGFKKEKKRNEKAMFCGCPKG